MSKVFFSRAGRIGRKAAAQRAPELAPLHGATVCVFGLGCLGAPSTMELARAGVMRLRVIDHDFVDPATTGRWPFGLQVSGRHKAAVLVDSISRDYPFTEIKGYNAMIGATCNPESPAESSQSVMKQITDGASLIYDATAEVGVQHFLSDYAAARRIPYVGVEGTPGGWGGLVVRIIPEQTRGCWMCLQTALYQSKTIPQPPFDPKGIVQPVGCADPTFTGAGFDMAQIALTGVRTAISTLCSGTASAYPAADWDITIISLRDRQGKLIPPTFAGYPLLSHSECPIGHSS